MKYRILKQQNGDTIIEVLISLAILALVLGGAYYTANTSFRNERSAQEHTEALAIAQSQLEQLKIYPGTFVSTAPTNDKCMSDSPLKPLTTGCAFTSNGASCTFGSAYCYGVTIKGPIGGSPSVTLNVNTDGGTKSVDLNTYDINVEWSALGGGNNFVDLYYRVDPST